MKSLIIRGTEATAILFAAILLLACPNPLRDSLEDAANEDLPGAELQSADPGNEAYIGVDTTITVRFDRSLDRNATGISGDLASEAAPLQWASTNETDDTVVIAPDSTWSVGLQRGLSLSAVGKNGAETTHEFTYTVVTVSLDQTSATLSFGGTLQLHATVNPSEADRATLTWSSSDESVVEVDASGVVTAVATVASTAEVTVSAAGGEATAVSSIEVLANQAPYPVTGPADSEFFSGQTYDQTYQLTIEQVDGKNDPDGDEVFFRSSSLPSYMNLDATTGTVTIYDADYDVQVEVEFWSEDSHGADTSSTPFVVTFSFITS
jgi:hypothetical protein